MQFAKQTREADGTVIPASVAISGASIAIIEVSLALIDGFFVMAVLGMELFGAPKFYQQIATGVSLAMFLVTFFVFRLTRSRFDFLMQVAGVQLASD